MGSNESVHRRRLTALILGIFTGGAVHTNLPPGLFGEYDIPSRVVVTGIVAGVTALSILIIRRKGHTKR